METQEHRIICNEFEGNDYNVSRKRDILFWKKKYALNGAQKHIDDLKVIEGGERPVYAVAPAGVFNDDDLPF